MGNRSTTSASLSFRNGTRHIPPVFVPYCPAKLVRENAEVHSNLVKELPPRTANKTNDFLTMLRARKFIKIPHLRVVTVVLLMTIDQDSHATHPALDCRERQWAHTFHEGLPQASPQYSYISMNDTFPMSCKGSGYWDDASQR